MYAFCQDMPGATLDRQRLLEDALPPEALEGCIAHVLGEYDGGVRMIDVWTDEETFRRFQREHLWPTLDRLMPQLATFGAEPPPAFSVIEVRDGADSATAAP